MINNNYLDERLKQLKKKIGNEKILIVDFKDKKEYNNNILMNNQHDNNGDD